MGACGTLGLAAVGRPNNRSAKHLAEMLDGRDVLVVGENDEKPDGSWPGRDGAVAVARSLAKTWGKPVRWTLPPEGTKDVRAWLNGRGVELEDRDALVAAGKELLEALEARVSTVTPPMADELQNEAAAEVRCARSHRRHM